MNNKLKLLCCTTLAVIYPYLTYADFDPTTFIQDQLKSHNLEINEVIGKYIGKEIDVQKLVTDRKNLSSLKDMGKGYIMEKAGGVLDGIDIKHIDQVSLPGIGKEIKGQFSNGKLEAAVTDKMTNKKMIEDDIAAIKRHNEMINDLQVENLAGMYAKALVRRKALMNEDKKLEEEEKTEQTDLTTTKDAYKIVNDRANGRWRSILEANANYQAQQGTALMLMERISSDEEAQKALKNLDNESSNNIKSDKDKKKKPKLSAKDLLKKGKNVYDDISSGNISGALGETSEVIGGLGEDDWSKYVKSASKGYATANSAIEAGKNGDWSKVTNEMASGLNNIGGEYVDKDTKDIFNKIDKGAHSAEDVYKRGENKDYSGMLGSLANGVTGVAGDDMGEKTKDVIGRIGQGSKDAKHVYDSASNKDYRGTIQNLAEGTINAGGKDMGEKTKDAIGRVKKGTNSANNVYNDTQNKDYFNAAVGTIDGFVEVAGDNSKKD